MLWPVAQRLSLPQFHDMELQVGQPSESRVVTLLP